MKLFGVGIFVGVCVGVVSATAFLLAHGNQNERDDEDDQDDGDGDGDDGVDANWTANEARIFDIAGSELGLVLHDPHLVLAKETFLVNGLEVRRRFGAFAVVVTDFSSL